VIQEIVVVVQKSELMVRMVTAAIGLAVGLKISIREEAACMVAANTAQP
jgi:hypothetical protein